MPQPPSKRLVFVLFPLLVVLLAIAAVLTVLLRG